MKKQLLVILTLICANTLSAQTLKVMTYNIHHGANAADKDRLDSIALFIKASGADLIGLQEVDSVCKRSGHVDQMKRLGELTGFHYAFVRHRAYDGGAYGQGILSRYPVSDIVNDRITLLEKDGSKGGRALALLSVDVALPGKRSLRFASVHFGLDSATRMLQARETVQYLSRYKTPVILTGDLNTLPEKADVAILRTHFDDSDPAGAYTFPASGAVKKIDFILVSKPWLNKTQDYKVFAGNELSDHLPVMATISLKR
ncbi:endonuclease/exonuclease/phosphatase family protein [Chitinophaga lutea]